MFPQASPTGSPIAPGSTSLTLDPGVMSLSYRICMRELGTKHASIPVSSVQTVRPVICYLSGNWVKTRRDTLNFHHKAASHLRGQGSVSTPWVKRQVHRQVQREQGGPGPEKGGLASGWEGEGRERQLKATWLLTRNFNCPIFIILKTL